MLAIGILRAPDHLLRNFREAAPARESRRGVPVALDSWCLFVRQGLLRDQMARALCARRSRRAGLECVFNYAAKQPPRMRCRTRTMESVLCGKRESATARDSREWLWPGQGGRRPLESLPVGSVWVPSRKSVLIRAESRHLLSFWCPGPGTSVDHHLGTLGTIMTCPW